MYIILNFFCKDSVKELLFKNDALLPRKLKDLSNLWRRGESIQILNVERMIPSSQLLYEQRHRQALPFLEIYRIRVLEHKREVGQSIRRMGRSSHDTDAALDADTAPHPFVEGDEPIAPRYRCYSPVGKELDQTVQVHWVLLEDQHPVKRTQFSVRAGRPLGIQFPANVRGPPFSTIQPLPSDLSHYALMKLRLLHESSGVDAQGMSHTAQLLSREGPQCSLVQSAGRPQLSWWRTIRFVLPTLLAKWAPEVILAAGNQPL